MLYNIVLLPIGGGGVVMGGPQGPEALVPKSRPCYFFIALKYQ